MDYIFKARILYFMLCSTFQEWKTEVWNRDLDSRYCCGGTYLDECGCQGVTVREVWENAYPLKEKNQ